MTVSQKTEQSEPPETQQPRPKRRDLSWRRKAIYATIPLAVLLVVSEWYARGFRARRGYTPQGSYSYRDNRIDLVRRAMPNVYDSVLGYRPPPNYASSDNVWNTLVTIDEAGLRSNGVDALEAVPGGKVVVAVGDSFTFGDQVSDHETWPAQLEQLLQRPVRNAGVFGYGLDQSVLYAERMLDSRDVDLLICSLIPDDLRRCELSRRFAPKPWFALLDGRAELRGVPVPDSATDNELDRQWLRKLMGYSALLDTLCWNACPSWWVSRERLVREHPPGFGLNVGKRLLERLRRKCRDKGVQLLVVLQGQRLEPPDGVPIRAQELLAHGEKLGIPTLDLVTRFRAMASADASLDGEFFHGHMTAVGNSWVAEQVAARVKQLQAAKSAVPAVRDNQK